MVIVCAALPDCLSGSAALLSMCLTRADTLPHACPDSASAAKCFQSLPDATRYCKKNLSDAADDPRCCQPRCCQILPDAPSCCQVLPDAPGRY